MSASDSAIGILLMILATFLAALGYVLQKRGQLLSAPKRSLWRSPSWLIGLLLLAACSGINIAAAAFVDQSKSSTLGAVTLVFNIILSAAILKERFLVIHALSALLVIAGTLVAVFAAPASGKVFTLDDTIALFDGVAIAYSVILGCALFGGAAVVEFATWRGKIVPAQLSFRFAAIAAGVGGAFNGLVMLAVKVGSSAAADGDWSAFARPAMWAYQVTGCITVVAQVRYLNAALRLASALQAVPIFQAGTIISGSLVGIIYYHDLRSSPGSLALFGFGALVCLSGVLVLAAQRPSQMPVPHPPPQQRLLPAAAGGNPQTFSDGLPTGSRELELPSLHLQHIAGVAVAADCSESPKAQLLHTPKAPATGSLSGTAAASEGGLRTVGASVTSAVLPDDNGSTLVQPPWWEREAVPEVRRLLRAAAQHAKALCSSGNMEVT
jgi:hypothetical protein